MTLNTTPDMNALDDFATTRMLISVFYQPRPQRLCNWLVDQFSVRKLRSQRPDLDPESDEFMMALPEMPWLATVVFDWADRRSARIIERWTTAQVLDGVEPPMKFRRGPVPVA